MDGNYVLQSVIASFGPLGKISIFKGRCTLSDALKPFSKTRASSVSMVYTGKRFEDMKPTGRKFK